jgi:hypothetical protein
MKKTVAAAMLALALFVFAVHAHAEGMVDYGRITRNLNGEPLNPAAPMRTKLGADGRLMGEFPSATGPAWKDMDRQPWLVMPLRDNLKYYMKDGTVKDGMFTRASTAYYRNQYGAWTLAAANEARFGFENMSTADGWHWTKAGYTDEDSVANLALQSGSPASQTVSLSTTGYYTLWVEGTGSCAVAANTAVGTGFGTATDGSYVVINITSVGTVDLTVTGSLARFQLEKGCNPTSYIPTTTVAVTRAVDVLTFPSAGVVDDAAGTLALDYYSLQRKGVAPSGFAKWYLLVDFGASRYPIGLNSTVAKVQGNDGTSSVSADFDWGQKVCTFVAGWGGATRKIYNKTQGTDASGTYDGSWDAGPSIEVGRLSGANGHVSNLRIWKGVRLKDSEVNGL